MSATEGKVGDIKISKSGVFWATFLVRKRQLIEIKTLHKGALNATNNRMYCLFL